MVVFYTSLIKHIDSSFPLPADSDKQDNALAFVFAREVSRIPARRISRPLALVPSISGAVTRDQRFHWSLYERTYEARYLPLQVGHVLARAYNGA